MANIKSTLRDIKRWPHVKEKWIKAIMEVRKESILGNTPPIPYICKSVHPNGNGNPTTVTEHSATAKSDIGGESRQAIRDWAGAKRIDKTFAKLNKTSHGNMVGKFLDSGNGESSAVVAEYDEERERQIAEAIFDWWISKEPFNSWFAKKYLQGKLFNDEDFK